MSDSPPQGFGGTPPPLTQFIYYSAASLMPTINTTTEITRFTYTYSASTPDASVGQKPIIAVLDYGFFMCDAVTTTSGDALLLQVSVDGGSTWTNLLSYNPGGRSGSNTGSASSQNGIQGDPSVVTQIIIRAAYLSGATQATIKNIHIKGNILILTRS